VEADVGCAIRIQLGKDIVLVEGLARMDVSRMRIVRVGYVWILVVGRFAITLLTSKFDFVCLGEWRQGVC
jgi:hypothetical protein